MGIETPPADRLNCIPSKLFCDASPELSNFVGDDKLRVNISEDRADYAPHLTPESLLDFCRSPINVQQARHITLSTPNTCNSLSPPSSRVSHQNNCLYGILVETDSETFKLRMPDTTPFYETYDPCLSETAT